MAMDVHLYHNKSAPNVLKKDITGKHTVTATFAEEDYLSVTNPKLLLDLGGVSNMVKYNYCYIPSLKRYYYIEDIVTEGGLMVITCRVDVLMSFKEDLWDSRQYVIRSEKKNNSPYLEDAMLPIRSDHNYVYQSFGEHVIDKSCNRVILATTGLGGTPVT